MFHTVAALAGAFAGSFVVAFSGAMMPGPLLTVTIAESGRRGAKAGPLLIVGHSVLELVMLAALLLGAGPFLQQRWTTVVLGLAGGTVLTWMAVGIFRAVPTLRVEAGPQPTSPGRHPVVVGVLMSLANPYWALWWATIGLGYLTFARQLGLPGVVVFFLGHILGDFVWYTAVSWSFSHGRRFLSDKVYRGIMIVCGVALAGFAVWFGWQGATVLCRIPQA
jgi:threonine/homoserine/homoserine lactone efflux protein